MHIHHYLCLHLIVPVILIEHPCDPLLVVSDDWKDQVISSLYLLLTEPGTVTSAPCHCLLAVAIDLVMFES